MAEPSEELPDLKPGEEGALPALLALGSESDTILRSLQLLPSHPDSLELFLASSAGA